MSVDSLKNPIMPIRPQALVSAWICPALVGCVLYWIFISSAMHILADSRYALVTSHTMLRYGTPTLDRWFRAPEEGGAGWAPSYHIVEEGQHVFYMFPYGSSFLAAPVVALVELSGGPRVVTADGQYDYAAEESIQHTIAAVLMAVAGMVWFQSARQVLPVGHATVLALGTALGTSVWSTAALTLWCQTWAVLLLCCSLALVISAEVRKGPVKTILLGSLLSWCFLVRPTMAISAVAVTIYFGIRRPRQLIPLMLTGGLWFAAFLVWCRAIHGQWLPTYFHAGRLSFIHFAEALPGNLVSPARGFFVYVPIAAYVLYSTARYARFSRLRPLAWTASACIVVHLIAVSGFGHWWGGFSFGPRLQLEMIPWWFVMAVVAEDGRRVAAVPRSRRLIEWSTAAVLLTVSIGIHALGANSLSVAEWNVFPVEVDAAPGRLWDWSDVPFLRPWTTH